jgi:hypothetical protein
MGFTLLNAPVVEPYTENTGCAGAQVQKQLAVRTCGERGRRE